MVPMCIRAVARYYITLAVMRVLFTVWWKAPLALARTDRITEISPLSQRRRSSEDVKSCRLIHIYRGSPNSYLAMVKQRTRPTMSCGGGVVN